jgi:serine/threonine protein kinase
MQFIRGQALDEVIGELRRLRKEHGAAASLLGGSKATTESGSQQEYFRSVARIGLQVAEALGHAHGEGVLHRDIKPSNLILDAKRTVWVTDFGLAKAEGSDNLTLSGDVVGTLAYMAPERFEGWSDHRSDIYGLGLTLYELLTLRPAFKDTDRNRLIKKVTDADPKRPSRLARHIPRDLETIVMRRSPRTRGNAISQPLNWRTTSGASSATSRSWPGALRSGKKRGNGCGATRQRPP